LRYDMDNSVCHNNPLRWAILSVVSVSLVAAQTWRKVGSSAVETGLAGPAGGPVAQVWFSEDSVQLYARTPLGLTFVTRDLETWTAAPADTPRREASLDRAPARLPEVHINLRAGGAGRLYAFASQVYSSEDGGRTWINLTAFNGRSVIGEGQHDLAVSGRDPQLVVVANDAGLWCSHDGGLSWTGLNEGLPNLPVRGLLPDNAIFIERIGSAKLDRHAGWVSAAGEQPGTALLSAKLGANITATGGSGDFWYAGAADGRIWTSSDARATWTLSTVQISGPVERFAVDADAPRIAFLAGAGRGAHLFRTMNGGQTWDDITGTLADTPAHGIAADRASGAVYVTTDRGVYLSRMDVNALGPASPWISISAGLPTGSIVEDVRLEAAGRQLRVAVDGWGVYESRAPHQMVAAKLVNAADLSARAAAPGGLVTAVGVAVESASAAGQQFPVLARSAEGSQIQVPFGTEPSQLQLELDRTVRVGLTVKAVSPVVFVDADGAPLLLDSETGMMLDQSKPALAGSSIQIVLTGLGKVTPDWPSGVPAPLTNTPLVTANVLAYLNGRPVEVMTATLAPGYVGMYLVEIRIPALLDAGVGDLYLVAEGETSNHVRLSVGY